MTTNKIYLSHEEIVQLLRDLWQTGSEDAQVECVGGNYRGYLPTLINIEAWLSEWLRNRNHCLKCGAIMPNIKESRMLPYCPHCEDIFQTELLQEIKAKSKVGRK